MSPRDKTLILVGILLALFLGALDQTIVATALPRIVEDLNGLKRYAWVATAYLLASTALVPIYGKLADTVSRKSIEIFSVVTFLLGSFLSGLSGEFGHLPVLGDGMSQLIIFRGLQGIGGAGLFSMAFIIIADLFPPNVRGRYQGLVGATFGIASVIGPWLGGLLTDYAGGIIPGVAGWRWVFYVNVPTGAVALWFLLTRMPPLRPSQDHKPMDVLGATLLIAGLVPIVLALQLDKSTYPWGGAVTLALLGGGALMLVGFVARSLRSANPILDMSLFKNRVFSTANLALFFLGGAFLSLVIFLPLFMVNVVGVSATRAGLSLIPLSLGLVVGSVISGQLVSRFGRYRLLMLIGAAILFVGVLLLSRMGPGVPYLRVTAFMVIAGLGVGPSMPLYPLAIQNAVDFRRIGQATSASQFFRQIGGTVGAAVMGTVLAGSLTASFSAMQTPAGMGPSGFGGGGQVSAEGLDQVRAGITRAFDSQYQAIADAVRTGDTARLEQVVGASPMPATAKALVLMGGRRAVQDPQARAGFLSQLESQFKAQAASVAEQVTTAIRQAFATAVTHVYRDLLVVVMAGFLATLFVPVLTLRSSNEHAVPVALE
ncbi:MAG: MDR family MFS transporter [Deinococcales bacterium]